mmetsp:Transcript_76104/g.134370  ORF Transcript_76104/g.134370 Transcript_76104/m.134370 type:complete len:80 (-) Transcript_76104:174-413(-)
MFPNRCKDGAKKHLSCKELRPPMCSVRICFGVFPTPRAHFATTSSPHGQTNSLISYQPWQGVKKAQPRLPSRLAQPVNE